MNWIVEASLPLIALGLMIGGAIPGLFVRGWWWNLGSAVVGLATFLIWRDSWISDVLWWVLGACWFAAEHLFLLLCSLASALCGLGAGGGQGAVDVAFNHAPIIAILVACGVFCGIMRRRVRRRHQEAQRRVFSRVRL